jgi:RNA polymerase sigma-70 factor, ECF subfamily
MMRAAGGGGRRESADADLAAAVQDALRTGDDARLAVVLGPDVRVVVDSGGALPEAIEPAHGPDDGLRLLLLALGPSDALDIRPHSVNGRTALLCRREGRVVAIVAVHGRIGRVQDVWVVLSAEKLSHWNRPS